MRHVVAVFAALVFCTSAYASELRRSTKPIPDEYIVTLRSDIPSNEVRATAHALAQMHGGSVIVIMANGIKAFGAKLKPAQAERLALHPLVEAIQENGEAEFSYTTIQLPSNNDV